MPWFGVLGVTGQLVAGTETIPIASWNRSTVGGRRILLVTVDGRQPRSSTGMTLRESATLMRALGATEAINLDGGGSTAMALRNGLGGAVLANHPSDKEGERPVADALLVIRSCR